MTIDISRVSKGFRVVATEANGAETTLTKLARDSWRAVTVEPDGATRRVAANDYMVGCLLSQATVSAAK